MGLLSITKFFVLLFIWYCNGALFLKLVNYENIVYKRRILFNIVLNLVIGISLCLALSHLPAFLLHSYSKSLYIYFPISIFATIIYIVKFAIKDFKDDKDFSLSDFVWILVSGFFAYNYFRIDAFVSGSWDRVHHAFIETVSSNNIYPPAAIADKEHIMDYYHYGVDLIAVCISKFTNLRAWDALSLQLGLTDFLCIILVYVIVNHFCKHRFFSILLSLFVLFYTSYNHVQFFIDNISKMEKFHSWLHFMQFVVAMAQPALKNLSVRLFFYSQSIGFLVAFLLLYLALIHFSKKPKINFANSTVIFLLSFLLYFVYPSMWYPIITALAGYTILNLIIESIQKKSLVLEEYFGQIVLVVSFFLGKTITFCKSLTEYGGVKLFPFLPQTYFTIPEHWLKAYMRTYVDPSLLREENFITEAFNFSRDLKVDLFSEITMREFGTLLILASMIFLFLFIQNKKLQPKDIIYFSGMISCLVPFLFEYILRPHEELRFFVYGKTAFVLYITICIFNEMKKSNIFVQSTKFIIVFCMIFLMFPLLFITAKGVPLVSKKLIVNNIEKKFVDLMKTVLKSGDVCIDDAEPYANDAPIGSLAGCYGIGYRLLRENTITKKTAMELMDPSLLKELGVNYVIVTKPRETPQAVRRRLLDTNYFERMFTNEQFPWLVFKFKNDAKIDLEKDYFWTIGIESPNSFKIVKDKNNKFIYSEDKDSLETYTQRVRQKAAEKNEIPQAIWLDAIPIEKSKVKN